MPVHKPQLVSKSISPAGQATHAILKRGQVKRIHLSPEVRTIYGNEGNEGILQGCIKPTYSHPNNILTWCMHQHLAHATCSNHQLANDLHLVRATCNKHQLANVLYLAHATTNWSNKVQHGNTIKIAWIKFPAAHVTGHSLGIPPATINGKLFN